MTIEQVKDIIANAIEIDKELPEPLRKPLQPASEFPIDSLPPILKDAVLALHDKIQAPIALCAQSVLAAVNLAVQGHADIMLPMGQSRPISCFFLTIAESGERKSSCDNEALFVVKAYEKKLNAQYSIDIEQWQNTNEVYEAQKQSILKKSNLTSDNRKAALDSLGQKPIKPLIPLLTCPEPTFEGLCKLMKDGYPSLGIFSSEGGQFIAGHGMKAENKVRTAASICSIWDGEPIKRIRAGEETSILNGRRLSMHLMVQPDIATSFLSDQVLRDQGMLSRILVVAPASRIGMRIQHEVRPQSLKALEHFNKKLSTILDLKLPLAPNCANQLKPRLIQLTQEATDLYKEYADHIEGKMSNNGELEPIKGFANKLPEHALRIGATMALFNDITAEILTIEPLKQSIKLTDFYVTELLRLRNEGMTDPKLILAEKLLTWINEHWQEENISLPDIYQVSINAIRNKASALEIVKILENHGWLCKNDTTIKVKGQNRRDTWKIIKL
jgi:hypothetical protein